ncbi:MAG: SPFH domain-containing protein [Anaerolineae bacterium]|jgi:membrane protease subunit (stomatin/prohibitin family)
MARVFDVVEFLDESGNEMVHRVPEFGPGDFRLGSQLIVRESQWAVFFRDGKALDVFGPGRHTLTTANIPLLASLVNIPFGGRSPFTAEVYFVSRRDFIDLKWGTENPIPLRDKELGIVRLRAFGTYSTAVSDPQLFVNKIVGTQGLYATPQIANYLRGIIISRLTDVLGEVATSIFDLPALFDELASAIRARLQDDFAALGLTLKGMYVSSITPTEETAKAIDERAAMGAIGNMQAYLQFKAARALGDAALAGGGGGEGGLAGAGVGLGAGLGLGAVVARELGAAISGGGQQAAPAQGAAGVTCPKCGTVNPAGAKFCSNCGTALGTVQCPNCGTQNPASARFCSNCGQKLRD